MGADRRVIVGQLFARLEAPRRPDPDGLAGDFNPAVRRTRMVDEPRDVAADCGVPAPDAIDAKHPEAAAFQVTDFARAAVPGAKELPCVVDDPFVLVDGFSSEH